MKRSAIAMFALVLAGCGSNRTPPIQVFPDMKDQPKYLPQTASRFFSDGRELRRPVPGTVARGYLKDDDALYTGMLDGAFVSNPLPLDRPTLARGQERFNIYCAPCHDRQGEGNGMIVRRGFRHPPSYHIDRLRQVPNGYLFDVIANGFGAMQDYAAQVPVRDRWAIVAYIRALQLSRHATLDDVPPANRAQLTGGGSQ